MKFITSTSIALVVAMMWSTPTMADSSSRMALEEAEMNNMDTLIEEAEMNNMDALLNEGEIDPAMKDQLFGFGKQNLISKIAGGGIKGSIVNQVAHRYLRSYGKKFDVELAGIVDAIINPDGIDTKNLYSSIQKSKRLASVYGILDGYGGLDVLNGLVKKIGGRKAVINLVEKVLASKRKKST
ncbi:hypothetical protein K493DRAFT_389985 [Basidiobolus meristosporus CBS 931.73]|uniref:Uncharacterized protein n=1 Tax=Basidiobolus meristosporus CBS 931.73 TaxID=1314790 RepID=A0A1Y1YSX3_9FUNG|nr:hypothetical protein K493DRAFT_389985 [Basidiobolus meristosporus CBS 931.73]|eukprot:ORY01076.1 hypothetical protein K493DRAFT_389985 [Basidiobolus meristosporus CBS 931.73]